MLDYITELSAEQEEHERVVDDERYSENDLQEEKVCIASLLLWLNGLLFILSSHWAVLENVRHRGGSTAGGGGGGGGGLRTPPSIPPGEVQHQPKKILTIHFLLFE
jgi:hypothetical protein